MLRPRRPTAPRSPMRLLYSVRSPEEVIFASELREDAPLTHARQAPPGWAVERQGEAASADGGPEQLFADGVRGAFSAC